MIIAMLARFSKSEPFSGDWQRGSLPVAHNRPSNQWVFLELPQVRFTFPLHDLPFIGKSVGAAAFRLRIRHNPFGLPERNVFAIRCVAACVR